MESIQIEPWHYQKEMVATSTSTIISSTRHKTTMVWGSRHQQSLSWQLASQKLLEKKQQQYHYSKVLQTEPTA